MLFERSDFFVELFLQHMMISLLAILFASVIGLLMGIFISEYQRASKFTLSFVNLLYTIPSLALLGLLIPFTGAGTTTAIVALTAYGLLPMVKNTHTGITNIDPALIEAAKGMGSTRLQLLFRIKLPLALPVITSGFRNMVTMTISLTSIAAFIGAGGLGVAIFRGITTNNMAMVLDGSILTALLAIGIDLLLGLFEKRMYRQRSRSSRGRKIVIGVVVFALIASLIGGWAASMQQKENTIHVASKSYTEQLVLGEVVSQYLDDSTDLNIELTSGISGGTSTIQPALEKGDYDMYVEYTGTAWNSVLFKDGVYQETMFDTMQSAYHEKGLTWDVPLGYNNTYGIAVRSDIAQKYDLKTYSDLVAIAPQITIGAEGDFYERQDGFYALCDAYGFNFKKTVDLDTGLKYKALAAGEVDALIIYTTDGQLSSSDVVILEDDQIFFPSYQAYVVSREDVLADHPELATALEKLKGVLNEQTMSTLNNRVDSGGEDPHQVAHDFLVDSGLIKEG